MDGLVSWKVRDISSCSENQWRFRPHSADISMVDNKMQRDKDEND